MRPSWIMKSGVRELESTFREPGLDCRGARDRRCEGSPKDALQVDPDGSAACIVLRDQGAEEPEPGISAHALGASGRIAGGTEAR